MLEGLMQPRLEVLIEGRAFLFEYEMYLCV